jgi:Tol biopolymer transport system component
MLTSLYTAALSGCGGCIGGSATSMGSRWDIYAGGGSYLGAHPSVSPEGHSVVYSTPETGHGDIYRFDRATGKNIRLTDERDYDGYPVFSRDGRHVLFEHETNGISHLFIMDADGRNKTPLTSGPTFDFGASYSMDGRTIVFCRDRDGVCHIWSMSADGSNSRPLTDGPWFDCAPSFSPDSRRIIFRRRERGQNYLTPPKDEEALSRRFDEVYAMNADGTQLHRLTRNSDDDVPIGFSGNGARIIFRKAWRTYAMDLDGSNVRDVGQGLEQALSLDGRRIVFATLDRQIGVMNTHGTDSRVIYRSRARIGEPKFTPDGTQVVFVEWPKVHGAGRIKMLDLETTKVETIPEVPRVDQ